MGFGLGALGTAKRKVGDLIDAELLSALSGDLPLRDFLKKGGIRLCDGGFGLDDAQFVFARFQTDEGFALLELSASEECGRDIGDAATDLRGQSDFGAGFDFALTADRDRHWLGPRGRGQDRKRLDDVGFFLRGRLECPHGDEAADRSNENEDRERQEQDPLDKQAEPEGRLLSCFGIGHG